MKKSFKDTAVGKFLGRAAPSVLDAVGDVFPPVKLLQNLLSATPLEDENDREEMMRLLKDYEQEELRMRLDDMQDARDMQMEALRQDDKFSKRFIYWLAAGSLVAGFAYVFWITFGDIPESNQRFADTILGVVIATIITTIYNFFFGSSDGSKKKDLTHKN